MISTTDIQGALSAVRPVFSELKQRYDKLPDTACHCDNSSVCCVYLPEMTFLEALHWIDLITAMPDPQATDTLRDFVAFYLTNPVRQPGCPFRKNGACSAYESRTFACRAYGLWSQKTGKARTAASTEAKKNLRQMWGQFDIELPEKSLEPETAYCDKATACSPDTVSDDRLLNMLKDIYLLSEPIANLQQAFEAVYQSDFSFLLSSLILGHRKAVFGKYAVIKEIVKKGTDDRLEKILEKVSPTALQLSS